jgi:hypothetical protein
MNWKCNRDNPCDCIHGTGNVIQQERQLPTFHSVYVEDNVNLIFQEDTIQKIIVEAGKNLINLVKTEMRGDELFLHNDNKCNFSRRYDIPINVYIHYVRNQFYSVKSKATSTISNSNPCTNDSIDLNIESSGDINFQVAGSGTIFTHQHGAGDVTLIGTCDQVIIYSIGTGFTTTENCANRYTWVYTTTTGKITVGPWDQLITQIYGSGNIYYKGNPNSIVNSETNTGKLLPLQ